MKKLFIILILAYFANPLYSGIGSSGAQFLQIGAGTRAQGMGSAYSAYANGLDAIFWNPAGLISVSDNMHFSITHVNYFADMSFDNVAFSAPLLDGVIGFSAVGLFSGDIDVTTVEQPEGTNETFSVDEFAVGISFARSLTQKFSVGATFKFINQGLAELSAQGWAMDLGATYNTGLLNNLRFGFAILNFGPDLRYTGDDLIERRKLYEDQVDQQADARAEFLTEEFQLPLRIQLGIAMDIVNIDGQKLVASLDGINPNDQAETFGLGFEYTLMNKYSLRAGYTDLNDKGFSAGASGIVGNPVSTAFILNYGFENHQYLGDMHRFGLEFVF